MFTIAAATRTAMNFAATMAVAVPLAANATAPVNPPPHKPYQPVVQNDVTSAYQYRTRILVSPPSCQTYASDADAVFLSTTLEDQAKTEKLKKIGADAAAAGCLAQQ